MVKKQLFRSREEWLGGRGGTTGGSEISAVLGISPWMSNMDLWELKTGRRQPEDMSNNPLVQYGTEAEEHIRELFALDFPQMDVRYQPNNMWLNDAIPNAHASLDMWMYDPEGRKGVGEIKTVTIQNARQSRKWDGTVPEYYLAQLIWEMAVTEADFGILVAQLKYERDDDIFKVTKHYALERDEGVEARIAEMIEENTRFWDCVRENRKPAAKLPKI